MAVEKRYGWQMPFVGTHTQREKLKAESDRRKISIAQILRELVDRKYGLVDGEEPEQTDPR